MSKSYTKTAKDIAFDKERTKLKSTILAKDREIVQLRKELAESKAHNEELENTIRSLESKIGIPKEEIIAAIEREKKVEQAMSFLALGGTIGRFI